MPVIIISAYGDLNIGEMEGAATGIVNWLQKPVNYDELLDAFNNIHLPSIGSHNPRVLHVEDELCDIVKGLIEKHHVASER